MSHRAIENKRLHALVGVLFGTAVGDSLGLPAEGMSRQRIRARWGGVWRHRFLLGRGMVSDDTEHTLFVAQALLSHPVRYLWPGLVLRNLLFVIVVLIHGFRRLAPPY